jgi:hypothetical protein
MVWAAAFRRPRRCAGRRASWIGGPRNDVIATAEHGIQRICDTHHLAFSSWVPAACPCGELQQGPASQDLGDRADTLAPVGDAALDALPAPVALHQVRREGTRDAPCLQRVRRVHQLEMQVRGGRVPRVADPSDHLAGADPLPAGDRDAARRQVRVQRVQCIPGPEQYGRIPFGSAADASSPDRSRRFVKL